MSHILQSPVWKDFQESLGKTVVSHTGKGWSYQAIVEKGKINSRLYVPYGPVVTTPDSLRSALESLRAQAKKLGVAFIRIEPTGNVDTDDLKKLGGRRVTRVQPEATSVVDLHRPEEDIIAAMSPTYRNLHRTYTKKGLSIHTTRDPQQSTILIDLLHGVAAHTGMHGHSDSYLLRQMEVFFKQNEGLLYYMSFKNTPIVAAFIYDDNDTRYYAHAAADYTHRNLGAGNVIVSQMIIDAKNKGLKHFDLYGIWPHAQPGTPQAGITRFKRAFGGHDVLYSGTWEFPVKPVNYAVYRSLSKLSKKRT